MFDYHECLWSSPLLYGAGCLAVTSCLCDADSFSVSLQTLPPACEEGCSGTGSRWHEIHHGLTSFPTCIFFTFFFSLLVIKFPLTCLSSVNISGLDYSHGWYFPTRLTRIGCMWITSLKRKIGDEIRASVSPTFFSLIWAWSCFLSARDGVFPLPLFWCCESMPSLCPPARLPECWISIWSTLKSPRKWWRTLGQKWGTSGDLGGG